MGEACIDTHDLGEVRWRDALVQHIVKVDILEERMSLDLLSIALAGTKPPVRVTGQEL